MSAKREPGRKGALESFFDVRDRIGAWCAALAACGGAVLLWIAPGTLAEEIPRHREIAIGTGAFGVVFVLALASRGSFGYRMRALLLAMLAAVVGGGIAWYSYEKALDVHALVEHGRYAQVEVAGRKVVQNPRDRSTKVLAEVWVEGRRVSFDYPRTVSRGERIDVLYAPERPRAILPGDVEQDWVPVIDASVGLWPALGIGALLLFCAFALPAKLWDFLRGPRRGTDPDDLYA